MITSTPRIPRTATYGSINSSEGEQAVQSNPTNCTSGSSCSNTPPTSGMEPFDSPSPYRHTPKSTTTDGTSINSDNEFAYNESNDDELVSDPDGSLAILMATVLVEDAIEHRSTHHKVDKISLTRYRLYHSAPVRWVLRITIAVLLLLAFFEKPSSLTKSSYPGRGERPDLPCGITEAIEFLCLLTLSIDFLFKGLMVGQKRFKKTNWLMACFVVLVISYLDWLVSLGYLCKERWRVRRILRPFFLIQHSSLMKKTVQSIQQSMPQILSVLFLMFLQIYFFTMLGMIMFSPQDFTHFNVTSMSFEDPVKIPIDALNDLREGQAYFDDIGTAVVALIVLLTTANNPDVMIPAYSDNRWYALYFIFYVGIGLYFFMNILLAVMYNQFKGSFTKSMQSSFMRRRIGIRAAYEVLHGTHFQSNSGEMVCSDSVLVSEARTVLHEVNFRNKGRYLPFMNQYLQKIVSPNISRKQFQELFEVVFKESVKQRYPCRHFNNRTCRRIQAVLLHDYFQYFGDFMSMVNVFVVTVQLATTRSKFFANSKLSLFNFCFIFYYAVEQVLMIVFIGPRRYFSHKNVWFESLITWLLVLVEIICIALYGGPFPYLSDEEVLRRCKQYSFLSLFNLLRIINMLIIIRLLRIIPSLKPLKMVASTIVDLVKNLRSFGGIVITIYYIFAVVGIMIFEGHSPKPPVANSSTNTSIPQPNVTCGSYEQLDYYANNFDDFAAALVLLWDVMVVNNWQVFLEAYSRTMSHRMYQVYFVLWWLTSVVVCINLFIALVIEAFITQWEKQVVVKKKQKRRKYAHNEETSRHFCVHEWFRADFTEPTEEEIIKELNSHQFLKRHISIQHNEPLQD